MSCIFEYGAWVPIKRKEDLKYLLKNIWSQRLSSSEDLDLEEGIIDDKFQPFLKFDGEEIRANNFVGFIQEKDDLIEIYPKVFRIQACSDKPLMLQHIFYWFNYCRKWKFPFHQANLDNKEIARFPELIIYLIANQIFEIVSSQPLIQYQRLEETMTIPKGSINFSRYINQSLSKGNFQNIECDYEPFLFDNKVNRIIKFCTRILIEQTQFSDNIFLLQKSLNILDEVEDSVCYLNDIDSVSINSFYQDYLGLMDTCKFVIGQQLYSNSSYDLSQWCLLFPMEYIFEDFVAGFLEQHFSEKWVVKYQKSDKFLSDQPKAFNMQHDIFLTSKADLTRHIIIDTKYKIRDVNFKEDKKKGISQSDLYQMVSYAFKRGCSEVLLLYPNITENLNEPDIFRINSGFDEFSVINVTAIEIPFWSTQNFSNLEENLKMCLSKYI